MINRLIKKIKEPSHTQGSTTKDNTKISHREYREETAEGQLSHRQSSTTENNTKISDREDRKETAQ